MDFRLKGWADRYLVLRTSLYDDNDSPKDSGKEKQNAHLKKMSVLCPIGAVEAQNGLSLELVDIAVAHVLKRVWSIPQPPDPTLTVRERNRVIKARFEAGESQATLSRLFGISYQRIHQIIRGKHH